KEGHWSMVSDRESAFQKLAQYRPKIASIGKQELFKELSFVLIDKPEEAGGRLYEQIPAIYANLEKVAEKLLEKFPVTPEHSEKGALEDLLGDITSTSTESSFDIPLSKVVGKLENSDEAR